MPVRHLLLVLLVIAIWGFNFIVIKVGLVGVPPIFLCFSRFFLTSIPAVFFIKRPSAPFKMIILYGLVTFALQFTLLFFAISSGTSVGLASILLQLQAFFSLFLAALLLGEKIRIWTLIGAVVSFSGIALVGANLGGEVALEGLVLVIFAASFWGLGSVVIKKLGEIDMTALVAWGSLVAWPSLLVASLFFEGKDQIANFFTHPRWSSIGAMAYIAYLSTAFAFSVWNRMLKHHPIAKIAPFTLLVPLIALMSSSWLLGEPLQWWKLVAGAAVVGGLCINLAGPKILEVLSGWSVSESNR